MMACPMEIILWCLRSSNRKNENKRRSRRGWSPLLWPLRIINGTKVTVNGDLLVDGSVAIRGFRKFKKFYFSKKPRRFNLDQNFF